MKVRVGDLIATKPGGYVATVTKVDGPHWVVVRWKESDTESGFKGIDAGYWTKVKKPRLTGWKKTGVCPSCQKRAITAGNCLSCGWVSSEQKAKRKRSKATASLRRATKRSKPKRRRARRRTARTRLRKRISRRKTMSLPKAPATLHAKNLSLLAKTDHNLSEAQNSLGRITSMDAKTETPRDYALADKVFSAVEATRRLIYNRR
jgi:hypothetical protein